MTIFTVGVQAVTYQAGDDTDLDGQPDADADLSDNTVTPNFGNETPTLIVSITPQLVAPATGTIGVLAGTTNYSSFTNGAEEHANITYDEVGIIDLVANLFGGNYLGTGENIQGAFKNLGRFTPHHYEITASSLINRFDLNTFCMPPSVFTYMGEPMQVTVELKANNAFGDTTENYISGFVKLNDPAMLAFSAVDQASSTLLSSRLASSDEVFNWNDANFGEREILSTLVLNKSGPDTPDGPYNEFTGGLIPTDSDGIELLPLDYDLDLDGGGSDTVTVLNTQIRYGRLVVNSVGGSEISTSSISGAGYDVPVTLVVEYYDSDTMNYLVNGLDDCSIFNSENLSVISDSYTEGLAIDSIGPATPTAGVNVTVQTATFSVTTLEAGSTDATSASRNTPFYIPSPFESDAAVVETGSVLLEFDLQTDVNIDPGVSDTLVDYGYLRFDWRDQNAGYYADEESGVDAAEDNPRGIVDFGTFQGHNRVINWQEILLETGP